MSGHVFDNHERRTLEVFVGGRRFIMAESLLLPSLSLLSPSPPSSDGSVTLNASLVAATGRGGLGLRGGVAGEDEDEDFEEEEEPGRMRTSRGSSWGGRGLRGGGGTGEDEDFEGE